MPVLRCKAQAHALGYSLERGDKATSIWSSVNSPTCGAGLSATALVFRLRSPFAQLEGSPGLFTLGPCSPRFRSIFFLLHPGFPKTGVWLRAAQALRSVASVPAAEHQLEQDGSSALSPTCCPATCSPLMHEGPFRRGQNPWKKGLGARNIRGKRRAQG